MINLKLDHFSFIHGLEFEVDRVSDEILGNDSIYKPILLSFFMDR